METTTSSEWQLLLIPSSSRNSNYFSCCPQVWGPVPEELGGGQRRQKEAWSMSKTKIIMMECNRGNNNTQNSLCCLRYGFTAALNTRQAEPSVQWLLRVEKRLKCHCLSPLLAVDWAINNKTSTRVFVICPTCIYLLNRPATDCATTPAPHSQAAACLTQLSSNNTHLSQSGITDI